MSSVPAELERAASAVLVPTASDALAALECDPCSPAGVYVPASSGDPRDEISALRRALDRSDRAEVFAACELVQGVELPGERATKLPCALSLAAAEEGSQRERWIRTAGAIAGSEARAAGIELLLPRSKPVALAGLGDDPVRVLERSRELRAGWRSAGVEGCFDARRAEEGDVCALTHGTELHSNWKGLLFADARDGSLAATDVPRALASGCDGVVLESQFAGAKAALIGSVDAGLLRRERLLECAQRMLALRDRLRGKQPQAAAGIEALDRAGFALDAASAGLCLSGRWPWKPGKAFELLAPLEPVERLEVRSFLERLRLELAGGSHPAGAVLPVVAESRPDAQRLSEIGGKLDSLRTLGWPIGLLWMAEPSWLPTAWWTRGRPPILLGFQATPLALQAARRWLQGGARASGSLPCSLG